MEPLMQRLRTELLHWTYTNQLSLCICCLHEELDQLSVPLHGLQGKETFNKVRATKESNTFAKM
ncbi:hypothetical protein C1H46_045601 [Malus baccata]|uniref:Uncharacterized protein n=1 Tax=Malus baccata TaxID=106549 RepID=A0A540K3Q2_MALBA|nr:hypothetical protein C1H46_045601 [Malus baccata]